MEHHLTGCLIVLGKLNYKFKFIKYFFERVLVFYDFFLSNWRKNLESILFHSIIHDSKYKSSQKNQLFN